MSNLEKHLERIKNARSVRSRRREQAELAALRESASSRRRLRPSESALEKQLDRFLAKMPNIGKDVFIAKGAVVLGDVTLGDYASVWFNAVLRGDLNRIVVGHHSNVQDNAVLHLADDFACIVGNYVTIGHSAIVHACTVGDEVLVGMGSTILDGAIIGEQSLIGANALVTQGTQIPPGSLVLGSPGKVARQLTAEELSKLKGMAEKYVALAGHYRKPLGARQISSAKPPRASDRCACGDG